MKTKERRTLGGPDHARFETSDHSYRSTVNGSTLWFRYPRQAYTRTRLMVENRRASAIEIVEAFPVDCEETSCGVRSSPPLV